MCVWFFGGFECVGERRRRGRCCLVSMDVSWDRYADPRFGVAKWSLGGEEEDGKGEENWIARRRAQRENVLGGITLREAVSGEVKVEELMDGPNVTDSSSRVPDEVSPLVVKKISAADLGRSRMDLLWAQQRDPSEEQKSVAKKNKSNANRQRHGLFGRRRLPVTAPPNKQVTSAELGRYHHDLLFPDKARRLEMYLPSPQNSQDVFPTTTTPYTLS